MSILDQTVTAKIQSGVLPKSITGARFGRGRGGHCAVCRLAIRAPDAKIQTGAFGETRLKCPESTEACWQRDRRVEVLVRPGQ